MSEQTARSARPWVLLAVALACRGVFLVAYHYGPHLQNGTLVRHVSIARSLLAGHGFQLMSLVEDDSLVVGQQSRARTPKREVREEQGVIHDH